MRTFKPRDGVFRSVCRICHGGCGALLTVKDGRLTDVRPDPAAPFNRGRMCVKGLATREIMYHPDRLTHPLRRAGPRGSGQWEPVTWKAALDDIAERLGAIRAESGAESIALGQGTGRHHYLHVVRFANQLGTPNWYEPGLANCFIPRITVSHLTYGGFVTGDYTGPVAPRTILFWGHNPLVSGPDGELSFPVADALRAGAFGIAVDPRRTETARRCGLWLPVRPGTDAALALAMLHVIIGEDLVDRAFVDRWTAGFDELAAHVRPFTPAWAEDLTGVRAADLVEAARRYATDKPSILEWGVALEQHPNALQTVRAVALLRAVTGNLDVPGADILGMNLVAAYPVLRDKLPRAAWAKRLGADRFKLLGGFRAFMPSAHIPALFEAMRSGEPYRVRALLLFGNNPLATVANPRRVREALAALDLLVATDLFMTPSAALADYVLPAAFWPEVDQVMEMPLVAANAVLAQRKIVQTGQCRPDEEIIDDLARRMNLPGAEETLEDVFNRRLAPTGLSFEQLKAQFIHAPTHIYRKYEDGGFRTPSGKVELYGKALERLGYDPLPVYREPPESPVSRPDLAVDFPLVLTTGGRRRMFFGSEHRQVRSLRRRHPEPVAELHPRDAARCGIADGDPVVVRSPRGAARFRARVTEDIAPGVVQVDHGWWFPERGGPEYGIWDANANLLTSDGPPYDPAFGSYTLRGLLCRVEADRGPAEDRR